MGRGERTGSKNSSKGQVWKRNVKSDDSDEDYMLEEDELDDQSDELELLVGDASDEESFGSFVNDDKDDDDDEAVRQVVRSKSQKRSTGEMKNGINKSSKKRKRIGCEDDDDDDDEDYQDEDGGDEEDDYENDANTDNEDEFSPEDFDFLDEAYSKGEDKKKRRHSLKKDEDGGDDEDDYENDANTDDEDEFSPEDLDFLDEEEELPYSKGEDKKKSRYSLKKTCSMKGHKRKTNGELRKKPQKKKRKGSSRSTKSTSSKKRKSKNKVPSSRGKRKRMPIRRKKESPSSDSDYVIHEVTNNEYTISEEEREQVKEANEFCRRSTSNLKSSKTDQEAAACNQLRILPRRKGKEKVEEIKGDVADLTKQVCGICLTEEGKNTVRGTLNCCNHFFCFACIIEWSKVESRCPLCKQRFFTISKPARIATRIDLRDVVIDVPERDQVYQPSEEELRGYLDPYESVYCTECHESGDDALMLLCDVCDSPVHTYCAGLGREVPEGNWYCEGCRPSALGFTSSHAQDHIPAQRTNNSALNEPSTFENMAEIDLNVTIPETPMPPVNRFLVSPSQPTGGGLQAPPPVSGVGVSTLSGRRRVHRLQYILSSNRLSQTGMRVDGTTSERRAHFFGSGSWGNQAAQSSFLEASTPDVETLYHAEYMDRLQENSFGPPTDRDNFPGRQNLARGQQPVFQVPSAADGTSYGCMQLGQVGGINLGLNNVPGCEWLQPCTNRLNLGSGTSMSPLYNGDVDQTAAKQQLQ